MTLEELEAELLQLNNTIDSSVDGVTDAASQAQQAIYEFLNGYLNAFETTGGAFATGQDFSQRIAYIQKRLNDIIGDIYRPSIREYLNTYTTIEQTNIALQRSYNELTVDVEKIAPARKTIVKQAEYYLRQGLNDAYVQPAKYLIMQQVTNGVRLDDARKILRRWNQGELSAGSQLTSGRATPNLTKYATQVARDSMYGYNGSINEIIAEEYELDSFIYTGDIIRDSRPFCKHLVRLKRKIRLTELPALFKRYPEGLKPNTTMKNFFFVRGGYSCRHLAMAVKARS